MRDDFILLLSSFLNVLSIVVDKKASAKADAWTSTVFGILFQFLITLPVIWFLRDESWPEVEVFGWLIAGGCLTASARFFWFHALRGDLLTRLAPYRRFSTVFALLIGILVLGEKDELDGYEMTGAFVMVAGGLFVSWDTLSFSFTRLIHGNKYVACVLYFALSIATMKAIDKYVLDAFGISPWMAYFVGKMGQAIFVLPSALMSGLTRALRGPSRKARLGLRVFRPLMLSHLLQMSASLLFLSVLSRRTLTLSEPIAAVAPLLVILMSRYWLGEKDTHLGWRFGGAVVMAIGYYLMRGSH